MGKDFVMDIRTPVHNGDGSIDCEINHPRFGWIPYTCRDGSGEAEMQDIWDRLQDMEVAPYVPPAGTVEQVKAEAYRRIVAICPEWKQRNLTAQASILAEKGRANWTAEELAEWDAGSTIWAQIKAIREASNRIEAMDPIPTDYKNDKLWE